MGGVMHSRLLARSCAFVVLLPLLPSLGGFAQTASAPLDSPVGRWKTVDDKTGNVKSIVAIREDNGTLHGTIEQVLDPDAPMVNPLCIRCEGDLKDHPLLGMEILWGMTKASGQWSGGQVLDPDNGKIYRCYLAPEDGGKKLKVRGYIGFALLGRTQYWMRVE